MASDRRAAQWKIKNSKKAKGDRKKKARRNRKGNLAAQVKSNPVAANPVVEQFDKEKFYKSLQWRQLRYLAIRNSGGCNCCGATANDGVRLHVDHIKPISHHPELRLSLDNVQVLCEDCNMGKGSWDETDWRKR